jgi:hypothetical protein
MAVDIRPDTLQRINTELMVVKAQSTDLKYKIRQRTFVDRSKLKDATMRRALRIRDHLITAPARHAPLLAAQYSLKMETVHAALTDFMDTTLRWISAREFVLPQAENDPIGDDPHERPTADPPGTGADAPPAA